MCIYHAHPCNNGNSYAMLAPFHLRRLYIYMYAYISVLKQEEMIKAHVQAE